MLSMCVMIFAGAGCHDYIRYIVLELVRVVALSVHEALTGPPCDGFQFA